MKIAILTSIARQVEGEFIFLRIIKANTDGDKLHRYLRQTDLPQTGNINGIDCVIEYGVIEDVEVEGIEENQQQ